MDRQWYRFWKKSGPMQGPDETYMQFEDDMNTEENVKEFLDEWAERVGGGFNTHYSYGFEEVDAPPEEWLKENLKNHEGSVKYHKKRAAYIKKLLADFSH